MKRTHEETMQIAYRVNQQIDLCLMHGKRAPETLDRTRIGRVYGTGSKLMWRTMDSDSVWQPLTGCQVPSMYYGIWLGMNTVGEYVTYWIQDDAGGEQHLDHWPTDNDIRKYRNLVCGILN